MATFSWGSSCAYEEPTKVRCRFFMCIFIWLIHILVNEMAESILMTSWWWAVMWKRWRQFLCVSVLKHLTVFHSVYVPLRVVDWGSMKNTKNSLANESSTHSDITVAFLWLITIATQPCKFNLVWRCWGGCMHHLLCGSCVSEGPYDGGGWVEPVKSHDRAATCCVCCSVM